MGWITVIGLGSIGVCLGAYAVAERKRGVEGLWGVWLIVGALLGLCGVATLRVTSPNGGLGLHRLLSVYVLVIAAGVPACYCAAMAAVKRSLDQEREFWAWSAAASWLLAVLFSGLTFTARIEAIGSLLAACVFFACWGVGGLFLRLVVYR